MTFTDAIAQARYIINVQGEKTEVVLPVATWEKMLATWERMIDLMEDEEDRSTLQAWLAQRAAGRVETISLRQLEQELIADGLLPG